MAHTQGEISKLSTAIARNIGAAAELGKLLPQLDKLVQVERRRHRPDNMLTVMTIIRIVELRLEELQRESREQDRQFFAWMDEETATLRH